MFIYSDGLIWMANPDPAQDTAIADTDTMFMVAWANIGLLGLIVLVNLFIMLRK